MLERGNTVVLLVSHVASIRAWAAEHGIPTHSQFDRAALERLATADHLFSIINGTILSKEILATPRGLAVNYHNGPLPRYAGVNAASWAILAGERSFGVVWHVMSEKIDGGPILLRIDFPMEEGDTAATVNDRCRQLALAELPGMLEELAEDRIVPRPQRGEHRTYFGAARRAHGGGVVVWSTPAQTIDRVVRAHTLGPIINGFGLPKLRVGSQLVVIEELVHTTTTSLERPGTILDTRHGLEVATATTSVVLPTVRLLSGRFLLGAEIAEVLGLKRGGVLQSETESTLERLRAALERVALHERWCARALARARQRWQLVPSRPGSPSAPRAAFEGTLRRSPRVERWSSERAPWSSVVVAALSVALDGLGFDLSTKTTLARSTGLDPWLDSRAILTISPPPPDETVAGFVERVSQHIHLAQERAPRAADLGLRWKLDPDAGAPVALDMDCDAEPLARHWSRVRLDGERVCIRALASSDGCDRQVAPAELFGLLEGTLARFEDGETQVTKVLAGLLPC